MGQTGMCSERMLKTLLFCNKEAAWDHGLNANKSSDWLHLLAFAGILCHMKVHHSSCKRHMADQVQVMGEQVLL